MENIKFYRVKIGKLSKKGTFISHFDFVVKSNQNQYDVRSNISTNYRGFDVEVDSIDSVDIVDETKKIEPKEEAKEQTTTVSYFTGELDFSMLNSDSKIIARELFDMEKSLKDKISQLNSSILKQLTQTYSLFGSVSIKKWFTGADYCDSRASYVVSLRGKLTEIQ